MRVEGLGEGLEEKHMREEKGVKDIIIFYLKCRINGKNKNSSVFLIKNIQKQNSRIKTNLKTFL